MENIVEVVVILAMLGINALFASYEMALASISRSRLEVLIQSKRRGAQQAAHMKDRLEGSLAVIQLGITLAGAIAAATGGAAVDEWLSPWLMGHLGLSRGTAELLALVLFVIPLSAVTIVFAELVPKMIGINNREGVALTLSPGMKVVSTIFHPAVFLFESVVKKLMRVGKRRWATELSPDTHSGLLELRAAAALARSTRMIGPMEERIVMSAVQLSTRTVVDAMVPERDITTIPASASLAEALIEAHLHMHTRYPVCTLPGENQTISGYITFKDIVNALKTDPSASGLKGITRPMRHIQVKTTLAQALTEMIRDRVHIALVTEGKSIMGLITLEDIMEELVGDIRDEFDRLPVHLSPIGEGWLVGGGVMIGDIAKAMGGTVLADIDKKMSLADWVDRVRELSPRSGDRIEAGGVVILVRKIRRNRIAEAVIRTG